MDHLEQLFHELGNENRLQILKTLSKHSDFVYYAELKDELDMNPNTLSFNLGALKEYGLIIPGKDKKGWKYRISEKGLKYV